MERTASSTPAPNASRDCPSDDHHAESKTEVIEASSTGPTTAVTVSPNRTYLKR